MKPQPVLSNSKTMVNVPLTFVSFKNKARKGPICKPLPEDFVPSGYSVICGRGRACTESVGNRRLRVIAEIFLAKYSKASSKEEKSAIVTEIMDILEEGCPIGAQGTFVRFSEGRWWMVGDAAAREKVGSLMRECLGYKSSNRVKLAKKKMLKLAATSMPKPETAEADLVTSITKPDDAALSQIFKPSSGVSKVVGSVSVRRQSYSKQRCFTSRCA